MNTCQVIPEQPYFLRPSHAAKPLACAVRQKAFSHRNITRYRFSKSCRMVAARNGSIRNRLLTFASERPNARHSRKSSQFSPCISGCLAMKGSTCALLALTFRRTGSLVSSSNLFSACSGCRKKGRMFRSKHDSKPSCGWISNKLGSVVDNRPQRDRI